MRSFPAAGWTITHVHIEDWCNPSLARSARVLLSRDRTQGYMLPVQADAHQIFGALLTEARPDEWHPLDPRVEWKPGHIPVIKLTGRIEFVPRDVLERQRKREADRLIGAALANESSLETAEGLLEMADGILGGHMVPLAAKMYLLRADLAMRDRLRTRFLRVAPIGPAALEHRLQDFPTFQTHRALKDAVRAAVSEALREPVDSGAWAQMRQETLARWWLRWSMSRYQVGIAEMAHRLGVSTPILRARLRNGSGLAALTGLPTREQMQTDVESGADDGADFEAGLADAHHPRIALFAQQFAALERMTGNSDRLACWASAVAPIAEQRDWMRRLNDLPPWQRAQQGSEDLYRTLLKLSIRTPVATTQFIESFGAALAGTALGSPDLMCASSVTPETGPIIALRPGMGIGATRFAIAHQLGHLLDPDTDGHYQPCSLAEPDADNRGGPRESFANAFAVYLLAPRRAVQAQVGNAQIKTTEVLFDAAADIATVFGLSAGASLRHVLNCNGIIDTDFDETLRRAIGHVDWRKRRDAINDEVEASWGVDRKFVDNAIGEMPRWSVEAALRRPSATRFDELAERAASADLLNRAEADALLTA